MGWNLVTGADAGAWVAARIGGSQSPEHSQAIALERRGAIVAGALFEQWNGRSIMAHIAIDGRMNAAFLAAIFHYPFIHCGAQKIICPIPSSNARSIALASNMGFSKEAEIKDADPRGDLLLFTLEKSSCRFLKEPYNGEIRTRPSSCA